jgi:hypothetical protein
MYMQLVVPCTIEWQSVQAFSKHMHLSDVASMVQQLTPVCLYSLQAYRNLARRLHPDKGGSSEAFNALQAAFDVLSDPKARKVYDALAADVRFRRGAAAPYSQVGTSSSMVVLCRFALLSTQRLH